jgi:hypothetical protein
LNARERKFQSLEIVLGFLGIWSTSFYFGSFLGPTLSGFLVEEIGFPKTTFYFLSGNLFLLFFDIFDLGLAYTTPKTSTGDPDSYDELN